MNYFVKEKCLRGIYHQINVSSIFSQRSSRIYFTRPWNEKNFESAKETNKTNACNYLVDWILYHLKFANITSGIQGRETKNHKIPAISWAVADKNAMNVKHASSSQRAWMSGTRGRWPKARGKFHQFSRYVPRQTKQLAWKILSLNRRLPSLQNLLQRAQRLETSPSKNTKIFWRGKQLRVKMCISVC